MTRTFGILTAILLLAARAAAQSAPWPADVFLRGVPSGQATAAVLPLPLADAVDRGLAHNLGALLEEQRVRAAEGARWRALADLLPHASASVRQSDQIINLAAFGFTNFPGIPQLVGPFGVFDARVAVSAPLFDAAARHTLQAGGASLRAEQSAYRNARELVIVVVASLYLEALADASRVETARAQVTTAEALARLADDQKASGIVAGIDVLRQQVVLESARQRLIVAENVLAKQKLKVARAIGLPPGQSFDLTDRLRDSPTPPLTLEEATTQAFAQRDDLKGASARVDAARATRQAAADGRLPSVHVDADYGAIGQSVATVERTFTVGVNVRVPIFEGGSTRGKVQQADAELRQREAEAADLRAGIQYEIAAALLDVKAADAAVAVARGGEGLARQQLEQAQDRFRAGVSSTIELVQAQDALATAADSYIASLHSENLARIALGRAVGLVETRLPDLVGGRQ